MLVAVPSGLAMLVVMPSDLAMLAVMPSVLAVLVAVPSVLVYHTHQACCLQTSMALSVPFMDALTGGVRNVTLSLGQPIGRQDVTINIPAGVSNGQQMLVEGAIKADGLQVDLVVQVSPRECLFLGLCVVSELSLTNPGGLCHSILAFYCLQGAVSCGLVIMSSNFLVRLSRCCDHAVSSGAASRVQKARR